MTLPLTAPQEKLWRYIKGCERSPSFEEMSLAMYGRITGKGAISVLIDQLERRGFVTRDARRGRTVVAIDDIAIDLRRAKTSQLLAELEHRGILLSCPA